MLAVTNPCIQYWELCRIKFYGSNELWEMARQTFVREGFKEKNKNFIKTIRLQEFEGLTI